jgi:hypothetical protein
VTFEYRARSHERFCLQEAPPDGVEYLRKQLIDGPAVAGMLVHGVDKSGREASEWEPSLSKESGPLVLRHDESISEEQVRVKATQQCRHVSGRASHVRRKALRRDKRTEIECKALQKPAENRTT